MKPCVVSCVSCQVISLFKASLEKLDFSSSKGRVITDTCFACIRCNNNEYLILYTVHRNCMVNTKLLTRNIALTKAIFVHHATVHIGCTVIFILLTRTK